MDAESCYVDPGPDHESCAYLSGGARNCSKLSGRGSLLDAHCYQDFCACDPQCQILDQDGNYEPPAQFPYPGDPYRDPGCDPLFPPGCPMPASRSKDAGEMQAFDTEVYVEQLRRRFGGADLPFPGIREWSSGAGSTTTHPALAFGISTERRWPLGTVPYWYDKNEFTKKELSIIDGTIKQFNDTFYDHIAFAWANESVRPLLKLTKAPPGAACAAVLGFKGRTKIHTLDVQGYCAEPWMGKEWNASLLHELMHVAGLSHEQQRPDRDTVMYVANGKDKRWDNALHVKSDSLDNYSILKDTYLKTYGKHDWVSIMHYRDTQGCLRKVISEKDDEYFGTPCVGPTMVAKFKSDGGKPKPITKQSDRIFPLFEELSEGDKLGVRSMYKAWPYMVHQQYGKNGELFLTTVATRNEASALCAEQVADDGRKYRLPYEREVTPEMITFIGLWRGAPFSTTGKACLWIHEQLLVRLPDDLPKKGRLPAERDRLFVWANPKIKPAPAGPAGWHHVPAGARYADPTCLAVCVRP